MDLETVFEVLDVIKSIGEFLDKAMGWLNDNLISKAGSLVGVIEWISGFIGDLIGGGGIAGLFS